MDNKETFAYWVLEREKIRVNKEAGMPKPWTDDSVFKNTYFCNVDREDDKVTQYIRAWANPFAHSDNLTACMIMSRFVNKPSSLAHLIFWDGFDREYFCDVMSKKGAWGSAYIVSTNGRAMAKHEYIAGLLEFAFERFYGLPSRVGRPMLQTAHSALQALPGLGSFMAAQVIADLKNTRDHWLRGAEDWGTFAAHGPGSLRGLTWFHERTITPKNFMEALVEAREWCNNNHQGLVAGLCNQNLQNCFCEYDKYMRVSKGTGRSKRNYNGY
jgi:hypothetical protein